MAEGDAPGRADAEADLVRRARGGDATAFGELVTLHQQAAFRVAFLLTGAAADAEDAAQEGFVRAYLALARFRDGAPFRPWLLAIVGNEARTRVRARTRRASLAERARLALAGGERRSSRGGAYAEGGPGGLARAMPAPGRVAPSPEAAVLDGETHRDLREALDRLHPDERRVVACRYLLGLSQAETAAALGIPEGTAKSRLHRGMRRLRLSLEAAGVRLEGA
jgi:RNA polymerase sigma-70 factor (ECF subfamily)